MPPIWGSRKTLLTSKQAYAKIHQLVTGTVIEGLGIICISLKYEFLISCISYFHDLRPPIWARQNYPDKQGCAKKYPKLETDLFNDRALVFHICKFATSLKDKDVKNMSMFFLNSSSESKVRSFKLEGIVLRISLSENL